jgi:Holliday junction resolvase RusA-like endonuclease
LTEPIRIVVPGVPRATQRLRHRLVRTKDGREFVGKFTPKETVSEQAAIRLFAARAMAGRPPLTGPIDLRLAAFFPVPASWSNRKRRLALNDYIRPTGKPDFDNVVKQVDALKHIVWQDDAQVTDVSIWKRYSDRPRLVIEVRPITLTPTLGLDEP